MGATMFLSHAIVLLNFRPLVFLLTYFGKNTLILLLTHLDFYVLITAMKISESIPLLHSRLAFRLPTILFFTLLIEVPVIEIINRFFPFLIGKSKNSPSEKGKAA